MAAHPAQVDAFRSFCGLPWRTTEQGRREQERLATWVAGTFRRKLNERGLPQRCSDHNRRHRTRLGEDLRR